MNKKQLGLGVLLLVGLAQSGVASSAIVSFTPASQTVALGNPAYVDLFVSGLGDDILTGFDLEIDFDHTILSFQGFTVPGPNGLDPLNMNGGMFASGMELGSGSLFVQDLSLFVPDQLLKDEQPDEFVLGTLEFGTLSQGTSLLTISLASLSGELDTSTNLATAVQAEVQNGSISVSVIPVPAAVWLFGTALLGLVGLGRRKESEIVFRSENSVPDA